ncbi:NADH:ubiquinone reductase (Na(+)-transporting) subunit E [candidate division KSB3 bacterium]|uniref:NADH:ubiquinone reductase (Na(+)-transporting) subunit E n=1 Tax=candidate division KSB3 bacterium TaxID=2044937 RepID=A0A9D5JYL3_9BACT|nr:NADH:ubiquinone reductase (Na(+)-transporting) subunit E [candidate division KSB3 bacterium]MBD3326603.1 NADH:ubiquinone reductase (Na(+)-transporting) subunit E [candidate division KSB3 bacterium]
MEIENLSPWVIFFASIFTGNILLVYFLGMCSYLSVSKQVKTAIGLGMAVTFVLTLTSALNYLIYFYLLEPLGLEYLRYIVFIIVIAAAVQLSEMFIERYSETLYLNLGIFLPLITVNCAILGVSLFMVIRKYSFIQSVMFGAGSGLGWFLAILALAGIRQERLNEKRMPPALRGPGIAIIITGLMAMAFIGFSGIVQIQ